MYYTYVATQSIVQTVSKQRLWYAMNVCGAFPRIRYMPTRSVIYHGTHSVSSCVHVEPCGKTLLCKTNDVI